MLIHTEVEGQGVSISYSMWKKCSVENVHVPFRASLYKSSDTSSQYDDIGGAYLVVREVFIVF